MFLLATVAMLMTSSLALPADMASTNDMAAMTPCCPPPRWQGEVIDLKQIANGKVLTYSLDFALDEKMKVETTVVGDRATGKVTSKTFTDYNTMKMYTVGADGKCVKKDQDQPMYQMCDRSATNYKMPAGMASYTYFGNGTTGGVGVGSEFDAWVLSYTNGVNVTMTFNKKGCIPVLEIVSRPGTTRDQDYIWMLNNIDTNVDPSFLTLPPECAGMDGVVG